MSLTHRNFSGNFESVHDTILCNWINFWNANRLLFKQNVVKPALSENLCKTDSSSELSLSFYNLDPIVSRTMYPVDGTWQQRTSPPCSQKHCVRWCWQQLFWMHWHFGLARQRNCLCCTTLSYEPDQFLPPILNAEKQTCANFALRIGQKTQPMFWDCEQCSENGTLERNA